MPQWLKELASFFAGLGKKAWERYTGLSVTVQIALFAFLLGFVFGGLTCRTWRKAVIDQPQVNSFGWIDLPDAVQAEISTWPNPYFDLAAPNLVRDMEDKDAFLWKAYEKVTGRAWRTHDQDGTGCCVGEGFSAAVEILTCVEIVTGNKRHEYEDISAAAVYALSREVGNFMNRGDGSTGAWAAKALMRDGCVSCEEAGDDNTTGQRHAQLARQWGRSGLPASLKALAKKHTIGTASVVRSPEEVRAALVNGYPVAICSNVGFEPTRRDADGFCRPGGNWPHCMVIAGYRADKRGFLVINSWGPSNPSGPKTLGQPDGSFWISWDACARVVRSGESYAISAFEGYPARKLDVFIQLPVRRDIALREFRFSLAP